MNLRKPQFSPVLRSLAAATLFAWIGALALCQTECCLTTDANHSTETDHHHAEAATQGHDHASPSPQRHDEPLFCLSLKSLLHSDTSVSLSHLSPQLLY